MSSKTNTPTQEQITKHKSSMMFYDEEGNNNVESYSWIQESSYVPSIMTSQSFLALPEVPLQPSVSSEFEFPSNFDNKPQDLHARTSILDVQDKDVPQNQGSLTRTLSSRDTQIKRPRREVHNTSERRRRSLINGKLKTIQELLPHCKKKDQASILDEAAKYIIVLKQQLETMAKLHTAEFIAQCHYYMQCSGNPGLQFPYMPVQQGAGMCVGCYKPLSFQLSSPASAVASFCLPTTRPLHGD